MVRLLVGHEAGQRAGRWAVRRRGEAHSPLAPTGACNTGSVQTEGWKAHERVAGWPEVGEALAGRHSPKGIQTNECVRECAGKRREGGDQVPWRFGGPIKCVCVCMAVNEYAGAPPLAGRHGRDTCSGRCAGAGAGGSPPSAQTARAASQRPKGHQAVLPVSVQRVQLRRDGARGQVAAGQPQAGQRQKGRQQRPAGQQAGRVRRGRWV